jgi:hypothetical protein
MASLPPGALRFILEQMIEELAACPLPWSGPDSSLAGGGQRGAYVVDATAGNGHRPLLRGWWASR